MRNLIVSLLAMVTMSGCALWMLQPGDPAAQQQFAAMRPQYESQISSRLSSIEGADAEFQGSLKGATPKMKDSPRYQSLMGKYEAVKKQQLEVQSKSQTLLAWAKATEPKAMPGDVNKLNSDSQALQMQMANVDSSLRGLAGDLNAVQMTVQ